MDYRELLIQELCATAKNWVEKNKYEAKGGVICIFHGQAQGWVKELPNPADWRPGVYAVSKEAIFLAVGGDNLNGAKEWAPV